MVAKVCILQNVFFSRMKFMPKSNIRVGNYYLKCYIRFTRQLCFCEHLIMKMRYKLPLVWDILGTEIY